MVRIHTQKRTMGSTGEGNKREADRNKDKRVTPRREAERSGASDDYLH